MPATKKRLIEAEDLYRFQLLSEPRLSPDGAIVVYTLQHVDRKTEKKYSNLWIVSTKGGEPRQFTYGDQSDNHPRWSPDGSLLAFLSNREDQEKPAQVYLIPINGGEARKLTNIEGTINSLDWSPDGKQLLLSVQKTDPEELERQKDEQKKKLGVVSRHYDRVFFKLDGVGYLPHERTHLWLVDVKNGKARQITDHPIWDEREPAWSPDGKSIAFISNRTEMPDLQPYDDDLFVLPVKDHEARKISAPTGPKSMPSFSPDGRLIAYLGFEGEDQGYRNNSLWIVPTDGSAAACNLTEKYDIHVSPWTINDMGQPEQMPPTWSTDGQTLYFPVSYHGSSLLKSIHSNGENLKDIIGEGGVVGSFNFDQDQSHLAYFYGGLYDPGQIHFRDMQNGKETVLTRNNKALLDSLKLSHVEEVWFKSPSGMDLQGWIMTPPDFDLQKKYPSILEIHGGPETQYGNFFMFEFNYFASNGYVVFFSNPRGGRGYGEEHTRAIWRDRGSWGGADYDDLIAWVDVVSKKPYIDTNRMGVTGGSYGGYMTNWIIGHTNRFQAAVTQRCVSNFISMWGSSDFNWAFQLELSKKPPFEDLEYYWNISPMKYIGNAKTPTMVIHNENDHRCPIEQGEQVYVALQTLGVDTEMVRFPEEFHGLSRTGRTDRKIVRLNSILRWMDKYLK